MLCPVKCVSNQSNALLRGRGLSQQARKSTTQKLIFGWNDEEKSRHIPKIFNLFLYSAFLF